MRRIKRWVHPLFTGHHYRLDRFTGVDGCARCWNLTRLREGASDE